MMPEHPIHLDAVLSALKVEREEEGGHADPWSTQHDLPLDRYVTKSGEWVFKASIFRGDPLIEPFLVFQRSGFSLERVTEDIDAGLVKRNAAINPAGGTFRNTVNSLHSTLMDSAVAEGVGDIDAIRELISDLEYLGGRRSLGFGYVKSIQVEPIESADWSVRAMPVDTDIPLSGSMAMAMGNLRAPYWKKTTSKPVLMPMDL